LPHKASGRVEHKFTYFNFSSHASKRTRILYSARGREVGNDSRICDSLAGGYRDLVRQNISKHTPSFEKILLNLTVFITETGFWIEVDIFVMFS
jgi:hypothetical protein